MTLQKFISHSLRGGSEIRVPAWLDSVGDSLPGLQMAACSMFIHMGMRERERGRERERDRTRACEHVPLFSYKGTNPIIRSLLVVLSKPNYLSKNLSPKIITIVLKFQYMYFEGI